MTANQDLISDPPQTPGVTSDKLIPSPLRAASPLQAEVISVSTGFHYTGVQRRAEAPPAAPGQRASRVRGAAAAAAPPRRNSGAAGDFSAGDGAGRQRPRVALEPGRGEKPRRAEQQGRVPALRRRAAAGRAQLFPRQRKTGERRVKPAVQLPAPHRRGGARRGGAAHPAPGPAPLGTRLPPGDRGEERRGAARSAATAVP